MSEDIGNYLPESKNAELIWCFRCQCFVKRADLKRWSGDDALHYLCPGCDADLIEPVKMEE